MKESIYKNRAESLKNFETPQEAINYYQYMLDNNPESTVYPKSLREFDKGMIVGLKVYACCWAERQKVIQ